MIKSILVVDSKIFHKRSLFDSMRYLVCLFTLLTLLHCFSAIKRFNFLWTCIFIQKILNRNFWNSQICSSLTLSAFYASFNIYFIGIRDWEVPVLNLVKLWAALFLLFIFLNLLIALHYHNLFWILFV